MKHVRMTLFAVLLLAVAAGLTAYAQLPLSNTMPAKGVLGTTNFTTNTNYATPSTTTLAEPSGVAVDPTTGKLFVADRDNRRVLRWTSTAKMLNGSAAEAVLGQPDFVTRTRNTGGLSASTTNDPNAVFVDANGRLWVADMTNNRVLRFDNASTKATAAAADGVLGQPDFVTNSTGTTAAKMNTPTSIFVDGSGTLWVADKGNNRVLRFANAAGKANGANADGVLGQKLFTTSVAGGAGADSLNLPWGVYVDVKGTLWVADRKNSRVLRFDSAAAKSNGAAANGVLGQASFTTATYAKTQSGLGEPRGVYGDALGNLYVADEGNTRIMVYSNAAAKPNGGNADYVLGQVNFTSDSSSTKATTLNYPPSLFVDNVNNAIWVPDTYNHRVLRYDVLVGTMSAKGVLGTVDFVTNTNYATPSTTTLAEPSGVAVDPTTGKLFVADRDNRRVLRWTSTAKMLNGSAAEAVLGQPDFVTRTRNTGGLSASTTNDPNAVYVDANGRLWVADMTNNRILRFDNASTKVTAAAADGVLGQPDFVTNSTGTTAAKMNTPTSIFVDGSGTLWVADKGNNRVLRFANAAGKANGANADGVLGQTLFTTSVAGGAGADSLNLPWGVYVDGKGTLWVADRKNSRVLRFDNAAAKANGAAANGVLGQVTFTTATYAKTQAGLGEPRGVFGDGWGSLYVADEGNTRIMVYSNAAAKPNGGNADYVLGQVNFTSDVSSTTANTLNYPPSLFVDNVNNAIWIPDTYNHRVLRYDVKLGVPTSVGSDPSGQTPSEYALSQNYPNPFNPSTKISFSLKKAERVTVTVYNLLGQTVARLFDGTAAAGEQYVLNFNAANLPSGVYLCTLRSESFSDTKKMVLMK
jgi:sugar lactone lactonase YvrE